MREPEPFHGHVVDFLMLPNFPVFNIADMCINVAAGLIILQTFRGIHLDGSPRVGVVSEQRDGRSSPTVSPVSGSTRRWRGCSASPAPGPPT